MVSSVLKFVFQGPDLDHSLSSRGLDLGLDLASKGRGLVLGNQGHDLGICSQSQAIAVKIMSSVYLCAIADCLCVYQTEVLTWTTNDVYLFSLACLRIDLF